MRWAETHTGGGERETDYMKQTTDGCCEPKMEHNEGNKVTREIRGMTSSAVLLATAVSSVCLSLYLSPSSFFSMLLSLLRRCAVHPRSKESERQREQKERKETDGRRECRGEATHIRQTQEKYAAREGGAQLKVTEKERRGKRAVHT